MRRISGLLFVLAGGLAACSNSDGPVRPTESVVQIRVDGPQRIARQPGEILADFPRIQVITSDGRPVAGVTVNFRRTRTGEMKDVITDAQGIAHFGPFTFGPEYGADYVVATYSTLTPVMFTGTTRGTVVERYQLTAMGNGSAPYGNSVGLRYVLMNDGSFYYFTQPDYANDSLPSIPTGRYERAGSVIDFYLNGSYGDFYQQRGGHFSRGTLAGTTMHVQYDDFIDFENETYEKR